RSDNSMLRTRERHSATNLAKVRRILEDTIHAEGFSREAFATAFTLIEELPRIVDLRAPLPAWRNQLPKSSSWWFLIDHYFAQNPLLTTGFVTTNQPIATHAQAQSLGRDLPVAGVPMILSGWSYALADLLPWS